MQSSTAVLSILDTAKQNYNTKQELFTVMMSATIYACMLNAIVHSITAPKVYRSPGSSSPKFEDKEKHFMTLTPDEIQFWGNDDHFDALYFHPGYLFLFDPVAAAYVIA